MLPRVRHAVLFDLLALEAALLLVSLASSAKKLVVLLICSDLVRIESICNVAVFGLGDGSLEPGLSWHRLGAVSLLVVALVCQQDRGAELVLHVVGVDAWEIAEESCVLLLVLRWPGCNLHVGLVY